MRYLGIDYGSKKVGIAISDEAGRMGFPYTIILNSPNLMNEIKAIVEKERVGGVVIGESKNFKGQDNPIAKDARAFGDRIFLDTGLPVSYESEVLTSAEAGRQYEQKTKTRAPKVRAKVDASAAALILTSYLSKHDHA